jgi:3-dehydroquinate dehydratase/shikimate dehydrogenase
VDRQTPATRVFAVIGRPISHSRSPAYHNGRFAQDGVDAVYVPVLVDEVAAFFELTEMLPVLGASVTIPHKQHVIRYLTEPGDDVRAAQACNTVVRVPQGWRGINTDVIGFLAPLDEVLTVSLAGTTVLVLGAGGAARGVLYALLSREADVLVWNRTASRAGELASSMADFAAGGSVRAVEAASGELSRIDVVVNTTSVGMHGEGDPAPWYEFRGHEVVYDIVYTPPDTPMIQRAAEAGCRVITGDRMFRAQAAAQYELYRTLATGESVSV